MVKFKRRYYLIEDVENGTAQLSHKVIFAAVSAKIGELFGDFGHAAVANKFGRYPINAPAGMLVIKAPAEYAYMVDAALPFVSSVGGRPVQLLLLRRSSTIRSLYLLAWKLHNRRLQAEAALTNDPEVIQILANTVGTCVPAHKLKRIWDQK